MEIHHITNEHPQRNTITDYNKVTSTFHKHTYPIIRQTLTVETLIQIQTQDVKSHIAKERDTLVGDKTLDSADEPSHYRKAMVALEAAK